MKNLIVISKEVPTRKFLSVKNKLDEGLRLIGRYEKLSPREGEIRISYPPEWPFGGKMSLEIYAPHLIPNALSYSWEGAELDDVFDKCLVDLTNWVDIEKDAPRDNFLLDY